MSPEHWQRAKAVLTVAAGLTPSDRARFIEGNFPDEPTLRAELLSMLRAHDRISGVIGTPLAAGAKSSSTVSEIDQAPERAKEELLGVGVKYGPYRVVRLLGAGGMGRVFLAEDERLGRQVALKSLAGRWLESPAARRRLLQEAAAAAALSHPHIATLYDVLDDSRHLLLVMEYVPGRSAASLLEEGPLPLGYALRLVIQMVDAVVYAHDHGIIHCDLKPSNVQITPDGTAKVLDFGLARAKYTPLESDPNADTTQQVVIGTPPYMPPERLLVGTLNASGDTYSLGVTLFEMVSGQLPFAEADLPALVGAILGMPAPKLSSIVPQCPVRLDEVAARAMGKDPKQRYQTARELGRDLRAVLADVDTATQTLPSQISTHTQQRAAVSPMVWPYPRSILAAFIVITIPVILTFSGFITSLSYNVPLGRTGGFEDESALSWPIWGLRAVLAPSVYAGMLSVGIVLLGVFCRFLLTTVRPLRRASNPFWVAAGRLSRLMRATQTRTLAQVLIVIQVVALFTFNWWFRDLIQGLQTFVVQTSPEYLARLAPSNGLEHRLYRQILGLCFFGFGWAWYRVIRLRLERSERNGLALVSLGAVLLVTSLFLLVTPYRIWLHNSGERVSYESQACYLVGQRASEALLFCPLQPPPWRRIVNLDDSLLKRHGTYESIFAEVDRIRSVGGENR